MEIIKPEILVIGENIYSLFLSSLLIKSGFEPVILSQNKSAMLFNPMIKYIDKNSNLYRHLNIGELTEFLTSLSFSFQNDFSPIEVLYNTGDIVRCSTIYKNYNYLYESKNMSSKLIFVNIENLQDTIKVTLDNNSQWEIINLDILQKDRIYSIYELAATLEDDEEALKSLARDIRSKLVGNGGIIVLPPFLGIHKADKIYESLKSITGRKIFEALTLNPAVISKRFFNIQKGFEEKEGIEVIYDKIYKVYLEQDKINYITCNNYEIYPEIVVLISERFVEEGLTIRDNKVVEPIFNLPVFFTNSKNEISYFTEENIFASHNIFNCGIKINEGFVPLNIYGYQIFQNLYAGGSIILNSTDILKNLIDIYRLFQIIKERLSI
ncbi:MAG: hypothetical protein ACP5KG_10010 [Myxococcota bacterium]